MVEARSCYWGSYKETQFGNTFVRCKRSSTKCKTTARMLETLFPDESIQEVVDCTNEYLRIKRIKYSRVRDCSDTNVDELRALLGLLYLAGVKENSHVNICEL